MVNLIDSNPGNLKFVYEDGGELWKKIGRVCPARSVRIVAARITSTKPTRAPQARPTSTTCR
jgi:hypothetical protein